MKIRKNQTKNNRRNKNCIMVFTIALKNIIFIALFWKLLIFCYLTEQVRSVDSPDRDGMVNFHDRTRLLQDL